MSKAVRILLALLGLCGSQAWAATYYVDNCVITGSDSNSGTSQASPWLTIAKVNATGISPGDSVLFRQGCVWREQLTLSNAGSETPASARITYGNYGTAGVLPVFKGSDLISSWITASGHSYYATPVTSPNQVFRNSLRLTQVFSQAALQTGDWWLNASNGNIYVYDNPSGQTMEFSDRPYGIAGSAAFYVSVVGIEMDQSNYQGFDCVNCDGIQLTGVQALSNYDTGVAIQGGKNTGIFIVNSLSAYNGDDGFYGYAIPNLLLNNDVAHHNCLLPGGNYSAGFKFNDLGNPPYLGTNVVLQNSLSYDNGIKPDGTAITGYRGAGIWADTIGNGWTVFNNVVYGNNIDGIQVDADDYARIYQNIVYNNGATAAGQGTGGSGINALADGQPTIAGHQIYNNTVYGNYVSGITVSGQSTGYSNGCQSNLVTNNISVNNVGPNLSVSYGCENSVNGGIGNLYTFNDFGAASTNFIQWGMGTYKQTYEAWESMPGMCGSAGCSRSVQADPLLSKPGSGVFSLQEFSPARQAGTPVGLPFPYAKPDLGAVSYYARGANTISF